MKRYEPLGDARPAPPLDDCAARGFPELGSLGAIELEQAAQLLDQVSGVAVRKRDEVAVGRRIGVRDALGNLGEARMSRDEWWTAGGGGLGGDHPERLGKDRRDDGDIDGREQVD